MTMKKPASSPSQRPQHDGRDVHRIVFVTGKGGVGKSAVAAATALQYAQAGRSVLLVEFGSRSFFGPLLGLPVTDQPVRWQPAGKWGTRSAPPLSIGVACWDVESALYEYISHYLLVKALADKILNNTVMKALVAAAPSLSELALLGKLTAPMRHAWYRRDVDVVVVDAYATGQFMALLRAPRGLAQTAATGPMHKHTTAMLKTLADPAICEYRLVTLAEEMPIAEACEMAADLRAETGIAPTVYCNRLLDLPAALPDGDITAAGAPAAAYLAHLGKIAQRQQSSLAALDALDADKAGPVRRLPLIPSMDADYLLSALADALEATA